MKNIKDGIEKGIIIGGIIGILMSFWIYGSTNNFGAALFGGWIFSLIIFVLYVFFA